jgi:hypothetical protein
MRADAENAPQRTLGVSYDAWKRSLTRVYAIGDERYGLYRVSRREVVLRSLSRYSAFLVFNRGHWPDPQCWRDA